jgi:DNA-binding MarR family transcriptional regulator
VSYQKNEESIRSLANEIKEIVKVVRFDSLLLLMYASDAVSRFLEFNLKKYGQDQTRMNILYLLIGNGGTLTPTAISERVYRSKHAITRAIDILEGNHLVRRGPSRSDRRSINITITDMGIDLVKKSLPDLQRASSMATSCLTSEQIGELKSISRKLRKWVWSSMETPI